MNHPIAQIVALACHANAFLQECTSSFSLNHSTSQFCDYVKFVETERVWLLVRKEVEVAKTPDEWFALLKSKGVKGVLLVRDTGIFSQVSDRMAAGFIGGGGTWSLEVLLANGRSEFWMAHWEMWNKDAPDRRIWRVVYTKFGESRSKLRKAGPNLELAEERLGKALREIHAFAEKMDCKGFKESFAKSIASLNGGEQQGYHKDISPPGFLPTKAAAILDAAQSAWVFGGMGSWNDLGFEGEDDKEYNRVSDQLFQILTKSICAAVNSGAKI